MRPNFPPFEDTVRSKIEKVPRGIQGEKSSKDMASSRNLVSKIGAKKYFRLFTAQKMRNIFRIIRLK